MSEGPNAKPESDIYTVLLAIATVFVLLGTIFVSIRSHQLFGHWLPIGGV